MFFGRGIWSRGPGGWACETHTEGLGSAPQPLECLARVLSSPFKGRTVLVYEPRGMTHPSSETPKVSRSVFASLAKVRGEHPVVSSECLGWGLEPPEPTTGGAFETLLHYEMTPGLAHLQDASAMSGRRLAAAWPLFTACAAHCGHRDGAQRSRFSVFLVPGFVAVSCLAPGRRAFRAWAEPMLDRDWKVFASLVGDLDGRPPKSVPEAETRRGGIAVVAHGRPDELCPIWDHILESGRLAHLSGLDEFAGSVSRLPPRHPANLLEPFPSPRDLDRCLGLVSAAGVVAALAFAFAAAQVRLGALRDEAEGTARISALEVRLKGVESNRAEIQRLSGELPGGPSPSGGEVAQALRRLSQAVPDAVTLTRLSLGSTGAFRIEASVVPDDFKPDEARRLFSGAGFIPRPGDGWTYEARAATLVVCGTLLPHLP